MLLGRVSNKKANGELLLAFFAQPAGKSQEAHRWPIALISPNQCQCIRIACILAVYGVCHDIPYICIMSQMDWRITKVLRMKTFAFS